MDTLDQWLLSLIVFVPTVGALVLAVVPKAQEKALQAIALVASGIPLVLSVVAIARFNFDAGREAQFQFAVDKSWIGSIGANYHMAVDGISLPLLVLTTVLVFLCVVYSTRVMPAAGRPKAFFALILLLSTGMSGTFVALDLVLFFVFWELVLVPMYFLIAVWGSERKEYSAIKFFLYTLFGSVFMLLAFLAMYFRSDVDPGPGIAHTFDMLRLVGQDFGSPALLNLIFLGLFLGFAIKVPMWPFHTWLPDAHGDAPTVGSVLLAGILLKMGTYGFIRIALPLLPETAVTWAPWIGALATISIVYGALNCLAQKDIKRLIAFSSVGHMGFVMLGIATLTPTGINAAIFGMVAHGVITGMLFFLAGSIYERYHTREIALIGPGMMQVLPKMGGILAFSAIASLGLPGLAGFWGEVLALLAAFNPAEALNEGLFRSYMVIGGVGTILTAGYFLWLLQRLNLGKATEHRLGEGLDDVRPAEYAAWVPLIAAIVGLGIFPRVVLDVSNDAVNLIAGLIPGAS